MGGLLAVCSLSAAALDIWQVRVDSARGEPLRATVFVQTAAGEQVGPECLSLGDERDMPDPELPLIRNATFSLSPSGDSIQFATVNAITVPAVAVVLRVQCPGGPLYARMVNLHLKPAGVAQTITVRQSFPGATLKIKPGDTLYSIARTIFPQNGETVQNLVKAIVLVNPALFPEQRSRPLRVGEALLIPDLRTVRQILNNPPPKPATRTAVVVPTPMPTPTPTQPTGQSIGTPTVPGQPAISTSPDVLAPQPSRSGKGLQLKIATEVDLSRVGVSEKRRAELRRMFAGETTRRVVVVSPGGASDALDLKVTQLRESQNLIDQQIGMLEQAVDALARAVMTTARQSQQPPPPAPRPAPAPPKVIVRHEVPWWLWPAAAAGALLAAMLAFSFGRRSAGRRSVDEHEARIDRLLEEARSAAGPLLSPSNEAEYQPPAAPPAPKAKPRAQPRPGPAPVPVDAEVTTQPQATADVDLVLESEAPGEEPQPDTGVSTNLRQEMDLALDNTRSMFTDVDRFIALGRTENAISLLEFAVHKDEKDRDSWIKLMAVYRQENMTTEFEKAHRNFKRLFPGTDV